MPPRQARRRGNDAFEYSFVTGLGPVIHASRGGTELRAGSWMAGTSPAMNDSEAGQSRVDSQMAMREPLLTAAVITS
jgi:hypothetical protein